MSFPDRDNPYNFDAFLQCRDQFDYYRDDAFLQRAVRHYCGEQYSEVDLAAVEVSALASLRWKSLSDAIALPEKRLYLMNYDAHNRRIDRIVRPLEAQTLQNEIYTQALFSSATPLWVRFVKKFLIYQNGEACTFCPLTCTEGLAELLEKFADTPELETMRNHLKEGIDGEFAVGAQFVSEIQGGSDIAAICVEAVQEDEQWRLYGKKFFCSATHADYAVVAAKPKGSETIAIFAVPAWLPGDKKKEIRNGCTIDRLKWKMGTSELPTAEITYNGALAYPVGPMDSGLANVVEIVLTYSRLAIGISNAATMTRAVREARQYAEFREAFGRPIARFPMLDNQLDAMRHDAQRTTAAAFKLFAMFIAAQDGKHQASVENREQRFDIRELIMLQKITSSWDAVDTIRSAMSVFGGHGIMEDFSSLPRLFRDAIVNELWEGPRNVLLWQIHRDLQEAASWYPPEEFVSRILAGTENVVIQRFCEEIKTLVAHPDLITLDEETRSICKRWDSFCHRLFHRWQDLALNEI